MLLAASMRAETVGHFLWIGSDSWGAKIHPVCWQYCNIFYIFSQNCLFPISDIFDIFSQNCLFAIFSKWNSEANVHLKFLGQNLHEKPRHETVSSFFSEFAAFLKLSENFDRFCCRFGTRRRLLRVLSPFCQRGGALLSLTLISGR